MLTRPSLQSEPGRFPALAAGGYVPVDVRDCGPRNLDASLDIPASSRDYSLANSSVRLSGWPGNQSRSVASAVAKSVYGLAGMLVLSNTLGKGFAGEGKSP